MYLVAHSRSMGNVKPISKFKTGFSLREGAVFVFCIFLLYIIRVTELTTQRLFEIIEFLVLSESTLYGGSKMGSTTPQDPQDPQDQAVDFLWHPKVGWSGQNGQK